MPSVSRQTAGESMRVFGLEARLSNVEGGLTVSFETHTPDEDLGPLLEGLPNDECQFVRLGYVIRGTAEFRLGGGRIETYSAGDAYYVPAGHVPIHHDGAEVVEFSPTDQLGETIGVVVANIQRGRRPVIVTEGDQR